MKNRLLDAQEAQDINSQVSKILKGLGNPEPPLSLGMVRDLLSLDLHYYSSTNDSAFREFVNRITVAGKQIVKRPAILIDVIKKASLSALYLPDGKRILIDETLPRLKHRWSEAHEVGHSIIPWHAEFLFGDTEFSLSPTCHEQLEAEANYAAGRLLFLGDLFKAEATELSPSIDSIRLLMNRYGNTMTSTLWRYVEERHDEKPMAAVICDHPKFPRNDFDPRNPCRHFVRSPRFAKIFSETTEQEMFSAISTYCGSQKGGPLGQSEIPLTDANGDRHSFLFESFSNTHYVLTLAVSK